MDDVNIPIYPTVGLNVCLEIWITTHRKYRLPPTENKSKETSRNEYKGLT